MSEEKANVQLLPFRFDSLQVRVIDREGEAWFVASDVAAALEYREAKDMTRNLDDDEKGRQIVPTPGGNQDVIVINESGLYSAVLRSRKAEAKRFKRWVTHDVLPSIRKTGGYQLPATEPTAKYNQDHNQGRLTGELALLECFCTLNNPAPSSRVVLLEKIGSAHGLNTAWLPGYVEDGPEVGQGSLPTASATDLLSEFGVPLSAAAFNKHLGAIGILEKRTRRSRSGPKQFWCITDTGEPFGKNLTSPQSPRETQPHWYRDHFVELLAMIGMRGVA
ncbi:Bro-N domain-containing protein [Halomonas janggokensis]|uniref:Bro-N domain-containing protein n=1 Tax=Vreelandella janggokensis TaxID=370767 RepID=A0ABT4ISP6_9GAMM|nr:Bro-N domain-containing protein [Halomonas janggokensis]MCZ0926480.1 Bro-N domain-containing protein [Halomonas janggokensis]MCZ0929018.1 Bro-N domain-containing protein [Halomonas janggokensis]